MLRQNELVDQVKSYNPKTDEALLNRAYVYAMKAHGTQKRASGAPYLTHPLEVAAILTNLKLDDATIVAAVLHDTIEDTDSTVEEINALFGEEIGRLVDGLTKIKKLDFASKEAAQGENFRKLLLAISADVRVLLVKLADRLHNMRTLGHVRPDKQKRIATETLEIYAPLAGRMGMHEMREELEDLSFKIINPEAYATITTKLNELHTKSKDLIDVIIQALTQEIYKAGLNGHVFGRIKNPYSIFRKMERQSISFEQLADIYGFRAILGSISDCYQMLGLVHMRWPCIPGRFRDYISTPKENDYQSIQTTVMGPKNQRIEIQIRTEDMDKIAEQGIAAHALYKDGVNVSLDELANESRSYNWLRKTVDMMSDGLSPDEFLEHTKLELFQDQVFCFTPKGRLIALPRYATPIDFAYTVHTELGDTAVSCKINGQLCPLTSVLENGDTVEIIAARGQTPPTAWESMVKTGRARAGIRRATRAAARKQYAGLGRQLIERAFERVDRPYDDDKLEAALPRLARNTIEDVFASVGRSELSADTVIRAIYPDFTAALTVPVPQPKRKGTREKGWFGLKKNASLIFRAPDGAVDTNAIPIRGVASDLPVQYCEECGPVPGDRIVGILNPGQGMTIYPIHAKALQKFDDQPERWLDVRWDIDPENPQRFRTTVNIIGLNEPGTMAEIARVLADHDANIDNIRVDTRGKDFHTVVIELEVFDLRQLNAILAELRQKSTVSSADRAE